MVEAFLAAQKGMLCQTLQTQQQLVQTQQQLVQMLQQQLPLSAMLTVKIRQPSHEFTFGVGMSFIPYPLVLTTVV
jgi:hypothetical protein